MPWSSKDQWWKGDVKAYVDGSYSQGKKIYSYGVIILDDENNILDEISGQGNEPSHVALHSVAGELKAATIAMRWAFDHGCKSITVYFDYLGIREWAEKRWKIHGTNRNLVREYVRMYDLFSSHGLKISFKKVQAHSGDEFNERADSLAKLALCG